MSMIPFSGLSRFSGHFGCDGPSPLNRDTTVYQFQDFFEQKIMAFLHKIQR